MDWKTGNLNRTWNIWSLGEEFRQAKCVYPGALICILLSIPTSSNWAVHLSHANAMGPPFWMPEPPLFQSKCFYTGARDGIQSRRELNICDSGMDGRSCAWKLRRHQLKPVKSIFGQRQRWQNTVGCPELCCSKFTIIKMVAKENYRSTITSRHKLDCGTIGEKWRRQKKWQRHRTQTQPRDRKPELIMGNNEHNSLINIITIYTIPVLNIESYHTCQCIAWMYLCILWRQQWAQCLLNVQNSEWQSSWVILYYVYKL